MYVHQASYHLKLKTSPGKAPLASCAPGCHAASEEIVSATWKAKPQEPQSPAGQQSTKAPQKHSFYLPASGPGRGNSENIGNQVVESLPAGALVDSFHSSEELWSLLHVHALDIGDRGVELLKQRAAEKVNFRTASDYTKDATFESLSYASQRLLADTYQPHLEDSDAFKPHPLGGQLWLQKCRQQSRRAVQDIRDDPFIRRCYAKLLQAIPEIVGGQVCSAGIHDRPGEGESSGTSRCQT